MIRRRSDALGIGRPILVFAGTRFFEALGTAMVIPILPLFLVDLSNSLFPGRSPEFRTGLLFGAFGLCVTLAQYPVAVLSDRSQRRKAFLVVGLLGFALGNAIYPFVRSYEALLAVRAVQGLCAGMTFPPALAMVATLAPSGSRGRVFSFYAATRMLGLGLGPLIGGAVTDLFGFEAAFWTCGGLAFASFVLVSLFVGDTRELEREESGPPDRTRARMPAGREAWVLAASVFVAVIGASVIVALFPAYERRLDASASELGIVFSALLAGRFVFTVPFGIVVDRYGRKPLLVAGLALSVPVILLQGLVDDVLPFVLARALHGVCLTAVATPAMTLAADKSPGGRGRGMVAVTMAFSSGVAVGPLVAGVASEAGWWAPFYIGAGGCLVAAAAAQTLLRETVRSGAGEPVAESA